MREQWWVPLVQWTLWGVAMLLLMGWFAKSRLKARPEADKQMLRHPHSTLLFGVVGVTFFFGLAIVSNTVGENETSDLWVTATFLLMGLWTSTLVADYYFARHVVSETGIDFRRMFGQRGRLPWADVANVRYSSSLKWFVLAARDGRKVRVSAMLMGLPEFARLLLEQVPLELVDPQALPLLVATREGNPPSLWG